MKFNLNRKYKLRLSHPIDRKLLHKVGKQWVVISLSALFLLTGASALDVHAASSTPTSEVSTRTANISRQANQMHRQIISHANISAIRKSSHRKSQTTRIKSHFRRTNRKRLLKHSSYGRVHGFTRNAYRNYYAPNDRRAYVPRHFRLTNDLIWFKESNYRIHKHPGSVKKYTYHKHSHKWLVKHGIHKIARRHAHHVVYHRRRTATKHHYHHSRKSSHGHTVKHQYLLRNKQGTSPLITNGGMRKLQNSDLSNYSDDFSDIFNDDNPAVKIKKRARLGGYSLDKIRGNDEGQSINGWVFSDELGHRHAGHYRKDDVNTFKNNLEQQFTRKYFTSDEQSKIHSIKQNYNYLSKNESSSDTKDLDTFRQHEIDWINFYRTQLYDLQPVTENSDFDEKAQDGADNDQDPEDMVDTANPGDAVNIFFTDENDGDGNDEAGHRDSILNPSANQVGVGVHKDMDTLFFDWGTNNGAENGQSDSIAFPNQGLFPISDAKNALNGSCWSYQFASHPYEMGSESDNDSYTPNISVHDDTADTDLNVTDVNPQPDEVYYHVNADGLRDGHQYTVSISGLPNGNVNYSFKLFQLS